MRYVDHCGEIHEEQGKQDRLFSVLYTSNAGRWLIKCLVRPGISEKVGAYLDTKASRWLILPFMRSCHLDMAPYRRKTPAEYISYNDFFTRELLPGMRVVDRENTHFPSPCDGKATVYPIGEDTSFVVKQTRYTVASLLKNRQLAKRYQGGYAIVLRLCVTDYHRYIYPVSGEKSDNYFIPGVLHTVNPIAVETAEVFKENAREFTLVKNNEFGTVLQMEVGALMVGRICNYHQQGCVERGQEKGRFEFGGSTIILLIQRDRIQIREDLLKNTARECETEVHMGECLGYSFNAMTVHP